MSQVEATLEAVRAAAFKVGLPELARKAGVNEDTARRLLKKPPSQIENLIKLEAAAEALKADPTHT